MNLLIITSAYLFPSEARPQGGIFFANLLVRLARLGHGLVVVSPVPYVPRAAQRLPGLRLYAHMASHEFRSGLEVFRPAYFSVRSLRHLWLQSRTFAQATLPLCRSLHRSRRFDLVLGNGFGPPVHAAQLAGRDLGLPSVGWAIGSDVHSTPRLSEENLRLVRHNIRRCRLILAASEDLRRTLACIQPPARHVHVFYRGIDLTDIPATADRTALRTRLGLTPGRYMLNAGSTEPSKGSEEFYAAFKSLAAVRPDLRAICVGDAEARWRRRAEGDGLAERFVTPGHVPRPRLLEYMGAADVLAFGSHAEGMPNVVMEAMAAGLPVVATTVGGVTEILAPEASGVLVPPRDADALAAGVARLLDDPARAAAMAACARRFIREHFDVDRNARLLASILDRIARGGSAEEPLPCCAGVTPGVAPLEHFLRSGGPPA